MARRGLLFAMALAHPAPASSSASFPALHSDAARPGTSTLKGQAGQPAGATVGAARFRTSLVTAQIALSMALLVAAGLFVKSLLNVSRVGSRRRGGRRRDLLGLSPELKRLHAGAQSRAPFERIEDDASGAARREERVSAAMVPLLAGSNWGSDVSVEGFEPGPDTDRERAVQRGGRRATSARSGCRSLAGREFTSVRHGRRADGSPSSTRRSRVSSTWGAMPWATGSAHGQRARPTSRSSA
jgi:hypothetical protein